MQKREGGGVRAGVSGSQCPQLVTKKSTCGGWAPWLEKLPHRGPSIHTVGTSTCQHPGNSVCCFWQRQASADSGSAPTRCPCLQSSR